MSVVAAVPLRRPTLAVPDPGEQELDHDRTFEAWDELFCRTRDLVNHAVDALAHAGVGLRRLPEGSLSELLVQPLTGDPVEIRRNAHAVVVLGEGIGVWSGNVALVGARLPLWEGEAAWACAARLEALALAGSVVGEAVTRCRDLLAVLAEVSERLAITVERLLVALGQALERLVRRLLARVCGPLGWAALAYDVARHGVHAVLDVVRDVETVLEVIDRFRELYATTRAVVEEQRDRAGAVRDLLAGVR